MVISALMIPFAFAGLQSGRVLAIGVGVFGAGVDPGGLALAIPVIVLSIATIVPLGVLAAADHARSPITAVVSQVSASLGAAAVAMLPGSLQVISHAISQYYAPDGLRAALLARREYRPALADSLALGACAMLLLPPSLWVLPAGASRRPSHRPLATY
jgi:hypothetical protein